MAVAAQPASATATPTQCAVLQGLLVGLTAEGRPLVDFPGNGARQALVALSSVDIRPDDLGLSVMLVFVNGDATRPAVIGVLRQAVTASAATGQGQSRRLAVTVDGDRLLLSAYREVSLQCGKASIKLYRDGRIELRGTNLLSRSSAVNRLKGGCIVIN